MIISRPLIYPHFLKKFLIGPLSSSSSGHNMQEQELISASGNVGGESAKNKSSISSATTSPIKVCFDFLFTTYKLVHSLLTYINYEQ